MGALAAILGLLMLGGCGRSGEDGREDRVVVFAAASLRDVFTTLGETFNRAHPGVTVEFHFAGTQELHTQLTHGAAADVFASADARHMEALSGERLVSAPHVFAQNEPVLVVATESAGLINDFRDLPKAKRIVVGTSEVPIGRYTYQILERADAVYGAGFAARVEAKVVSRELNVRQVLAKVALGEADAGIVYRTDARAAGEGVKIIVIPSEINVVAVYPIAVIREAAHPGLGQAWVDFVLSAEGQAALTEAGFSAPARTPTR